MEPLKKMGQTPWPAPWKAPATRSGFEPRDTTVLAWRSSRSGIKAKSSVRFFLP